MCSDNNDYLEYLFLLENICMHGKVSESDIVIEKFKRYRKFMLGVGRKLAFYSLSVAILQKHRSYF